MVPALVLVLALLVLGYLARESGRVPEQGAEVLNRFVIDLCLPAALLRLVPRLRFAWELGALVITPWLLALIAYALARVAGRLLRLDRPTETVLFLSTALGNTSFLGYPLCTALLGERALPLAGVYDQLGSFLLLAIVAPVAIARAAGGARPALRDTIRRVLAFPPFLALCIALIPFPRPGYLDPLLQQLAAPLVPLAIFAVGLRLRATPPRELGAFAFGLIVKLGLMPLVALALAAALAPERPVEQVMVLESAMPAMITSAALATSAGLAPELAAALVGWGAVAALVTVPMWAALVR